MKKAFNKEKLHITFHNPNSEEETEKRLIQILAHSVMEKALKYPQIKGKTEPTLQEAS